MGNAGSLVAASVVRAAVPVGEAFRGGRLRGQENQGFRGKVPPAGKGCYTLCNPIEVFVAVGGRRCGVARGWWRLFRFAVARLFVKGCVANDRKCMHPAPMRILRKVERLIDREWAKSGYGGGITFIHILLCAAPVLIFACLADLIDPVSELLSIILFAVGFITFFGMRIWIGCRGLAAQGWFSTRRSERFLGRIRQQRMKKVGKPDAPNAGAKGDNH